MWWRDTELLPLEQELSSQKDEITKNIQNEIECPRCSDTMILSLDIDRFLFFCQICPDLLLIQLGCHLELPNKLLFHLNNVSSYILLPARHLRVWRFWFFWQRVYRLFYFLIWIHRMPYNFIPCKTSFIIYWFYFTAIFIINYPLNCFNSIFSFNFRRWMQTKKYWWRC